MPPDGPERPTQQEIDYEHALQAVNVLNAYNQRYKLHEIMKEPIYGYISSYRGELMSRIDEFKTIKLQLHTLELLIPLIANNDNKDLVEPIKLIVTAIKNEINTIEMIKHYT